MHKEEVKTLTRGSASQDAVFLLWRYPDFLAQLHSDGCKWLLQGRAAQHMHEEEVNTLISAVQASEADHEPLRHRFLRPKVQC